MDTLPSANGAISEAESIIEKNPPSGDQNQIKLEDIYSREATFEYDQLRKEILQNQTISMQILGGSLALAGTFISVAVKDGDSSGLLLWIVLLFSAEILMLVALMQSTAKERCTFMIVSYLRLFTEKALRGVNWETNLYELRRLEKSGFFLFLTEQGKVYVFVATGAFLAVCHYLGRSNEADAFVLVFGIVMAIPVALVWYNDFHRYKFLEQHQQRCLEAWESVRQKGTAG